MRTAKIIYDFKVMEVPLDRGLDYEFRHVVNSGIRDNNNSIESTIFRNLEPHIDIENVRVEPFISEGVPYYIAYTKAVGEILQIPMSSFRSMSSRIQELERMNTAQRARLNSQDVLIKTCYERVEKGKSLWNRLKFLFTKKL